jgi:hypothetical protein
MGREPLCQLKANLRCESVRAGQIRSFKIVQIDAEKKRIELEFQS